MAIPSVKMFSNEPGGGLVTALGGINALHNAMIEKKINQIKAQYMPLTTQADINSKNAYSALVGLQPLGKILGNETAYANVPDPIKQEINNRFLNSGGVGNSPYPNPKNNNTNYLGNMSQNTGIGQQSTNNFSGKVKNHLMELLSKKTPQGNNSFISSPILPPKDGVTVEGEQWYNKKGEPVYGEEEQGNDNENYPMQLELTQGQKNPRQRTWSETSGYQQGIVEEGKELGKHRADTINDIGQQQMQLSTTGDNLDRIIDDINDPKFMDLRKDFPFYQDMQLTALSKIGNPEQQEMIGHFIADVKSFAGATVNSFKGQSMKREFDYADQLKPNENDTVSSARGKLTALKSLKEIAKKKNDIIINLMQNKHMNIGDAVKQANKMVDIKSIGQQVKKLTSPMITLKDPKNPRIKIRLPLWEARQRGVKNV